MRVPKTARCRRWLLILGTILSSVSAATPGGVVTDGTLGTAQSIAGPNYAITQAYGQIVGSNLFHSFSTFNIGTGENAIFSSVTPVSNVIARVTGSASSIDGFIASTISGANLFFINPSGISFGPNARLSIGGSFYASTADYLKLGTTGRFDATTPGNSVLTSAPPSAFGFVGPSPATISFNRSFLSVPAGQTISVVGGDISLTSSAVLLASSGRINLASIASGGEVSLGATNITTVGVSQFGTITLNGSAVVVDTAAGLASGTVFIRGGQLILDNRSLISSSNSAAAQGGDIQIALNGAMSLDHGSFIQTVSQGAGSAGNINVQAGSLSLANGGQIYSYAFGSGPGGSVTIATSGSTAISGADSFGNPSGIFTYTPGLGTAGNIAISAQNMSISSGGLVSTETDGDKSAGDINLQLGALSLANGGQIEAETFGKGKAGSVIVTASGPIAISGTGILGNSGIFAESFATGDAGSISITAPSLSLGSSGRIKAETHQSGISGNSGNINLQLAALSLTNGGQIVADTFGTGRGGSVAVTATGPVTISGEDSSGNQSSVLALTEGPGNAGNINLQVGDLSLTNGGLINANTSGAGLGGSIAVNATGSVTISGRGSSNFSGMFVNSKNPTTGNPATRNPATGNAGAISVAASSLNLDSGALIQSGTEGTGNAGNINLQLGALSLTTGSQISADTSGAGQGGSVIIAATGPITISGTDGADHSSGVFANSNNTATGKAGFISVTAPSLRLDSDGNIQSLTNGRGNAGNINLQLGSLSLTSGGLITADTFGAGQGGSIIVTATGPINISGAGSSGNSSGLFVNSTDSATGNAGSISVTTPSLSLMNGAQIATEATHADGGNIQIHAGTLVYLLNSKITTSVGTGQGNGGNITIDPTFVVLQGSQITANAFGGNGGNISIIADYIFKSLDSSITASSRLGISGTVTLTAPIVDISGSLVTLPTPYLNAGNLLAERCAAQLAGKASSFVVAGRGGMPVEPDGLLPGVTLMGSSSAVAHAVGEASTVQLALSGFDFGCSK